jgi:hypothetical protein
MKRWLLILLAILVMACGNPSIPVSPTPEPFPVDQPATPFAKGYDVPDKWVDAFRMNGFGTIYDAYQHSYAWYDSPKTWIYASVAECKKHPAWKCYRRDMGGWYANVRPWKTTLKNMYAALGPRLRKYLGIPAWHTIPSEKLLIISTHSGKWVEVWIADSCDCRQGTPGNSHDDSLVDLSPQVWAALGAYKNGKVPSWPFAPTTPGWRNDIEIRFIP